MGMTSWSGSGSEGYTSSTGGGLNPWIGWGITTLLLFFLNRKSDSGSNTSSQQPSKFTEDNVNCIGQPVPVVMGRCMIKNPLISYYGDFNSEPYTEEYGAHSAADLWPLFLGTLIAIYLSTSDEMLPIMLSSNVDILLIIRIIGIKIAIGMLCGFIIDLLYRRSVDNVTDFCDSEHCHCEHGIIMSSVKHTLNISIFILVITFLLNLIIHYYGEDKLSTLIINNNIIGPFITSLIGLIPNCGASVILTELYLSNALSLGSLIGGLLTGSGVALLLLFKVNNNIKENINISIILYLIGVISGIVINIIL